MALLAGACAVPLVAGVAFASMGAWMVLPFAGLELLALASAVALHGWHACDRETIVCAGGRLAVGVIEGGRSRSWNFEAARVRLEARRESPLRPELRMVMRSGAGEVEVGGHFDFPRREQFAAELRQSLNGYRN